MQDMLVRVLDPGTNLKKLIWTTHFNLVRLFLLETVEVQSQVLF